MKKRDTCIVCGEKANCFYYYDGGYIPFCENHYGEYTNTTSIDNRIIHKKDLKEYIWRK